MIFMEWLGFISSRGWFCTAHTGLPRHHRLSSDTSSIRGDMRGVLEFRNLESASLCQLHGEETVIWGPRNTGEYANRVLDLPEQSFALQPSTPD